MPESSTYCLSLIRGSLRSIGGYVDVERSGCTYLYELLEMQALPNSIVMDNGSELTSKAMFFWSQKTGIKLNFINQASLHKTHLLKASTAGSGTGV